ncbi:MAG: hypothetical protein IKZ84_02335, partial [Victivallales bacterium]|nr:hypothetical protein [Victivallales bacterium]
MKSKFFIYVLPLILGVVATILMLNAPQPQKGTANKPVAVGSPADVPVVPSEKTDEQPTTNEEEKKDGETEPAEKQEETEEVEEEEETEKPVELDKLREAFINHAKTISQNELWLEFIAREDD